MQILQTKYNLAEILFGDIFWQFWRIADGIKKVSSFNKFHDQEEMFRRLDDFVHLNQEGVPDELHYFDLSTDALNIRLLFYAFLTQYLDCHSLSG